MAVIIRPVEGSRVTLVNGPRPKGARGLRFVGGTRKTKNPRKEGEGWGTNISRAHSA